MRELENSQDKISVFTTLRKQKLKIISALFSVLLLLSVLLTIFLSQQPQETRQRAAGPTGNKHYEYILRDGNIDVYDMDNGHQFVKHISVPTSDGVRGVAGYAATHMLYISHGSDSDSGGSLLAYDLLTDKVVWNKTYSHGIDSMSLTSDGKTIYMPDGELSSSPYWYVINAADGSETGTKINGGPGPHNTVVTNTHVYMGARNMSDTSTYLTVADIATNSNVRKVGPLKQGIRPFTINSNETLAYVTTTGFLGFQVADIQKGNVLYTVDLTQMNFPNQPTGPTAPSHGIAISPDDRSVAVIDWPNDYVHIFDVTGLPGSAPKKVADVKFSKSMHHNESGCAYDCAADGWLEYSRDGHFLYVGDVGDIIDTTTNKVLTNISTLYDTRKMIEVDFQNGTVSFVPNNRASIGFGTNNVSSSPAPSSPQPTFVCGGSQNCVPSITPTPTMSGQVPSPSTAIPLPSTGSPSSQRPSSRP
jgi:hypothetical protein